MMLNFDTMGAFNKTVENLKDGGHGIKKSMLLLSVISRYVHVKASIMSFISVNFDHQLKEEIFAHFENGKK